MAISAGSRAILGDLITDEDVDYLVQLDEGDAQGDALFSFVRSQNPSCILSSENCKVRSSTFEQNLGQEQMQKPHSL